MENKSDSSSGPKRLEALWAGEFGDDYVERNAGAGENRRPFWREIMAEFPARRVLEVGCNVGGNLRWFAEELAAHNIFGVDINPKALQQVHADLVGVNAIWSPARDLPFRDRLFDLVFTMGVLIHQPSDLLPLVMSEIVRCSQRFVLCGEYYADELTEVPYRGQSGALFKRDFGGLYQTLFPDLILRKRGFLSNAEGWDDVTYWVFEKAN